MKVFIATFVIIKCEKNKMKVRSKVPSFEKSFFITNEGMDRLAIRTNISRTYTTHTPYYTLITSFITCLVSFIFCLVSFIFSNMIILMFIKSCFDNC